MNTPNAARHLFRKVFNNKVNMLTREIVRYGWIANGRHAYEISRGAGINPETTLYGVTIVDADGTHNHELSEAVHSMDEVDAVLNKIRGLYR